MKTKLLNLYTGVGMIVLFIGIGAHNAKAHCEIPCGIYADSVRISLIKEHIVTIEKSMNQINEISASSTPNYNQLIRWVTNKEEHAKKIQEIVSQYFLHQRIKIVEKDQSEAYSKYQKHLELLHRMLVYSMKCKQTTDLGFTEKLKTTVADFEKAYFHKH
ncbi:MAG: superoxide dismutase, Ni [Cytophagales bacterium]|nr:superoxide dismutase, Ni [Cytophagales bacterium]